MGHSVVAHSGKDIFILSKMVKREAIDRTVMTLL